MPHPFRELVGMIPAESPRRRPAKIAIPGVVTERDYDLVCIGSPTWWQGGQVRSLLSLLSYLGSGEYRERYLGVKIPPTNLQEAREFADGLASRLRVSAGERR